MNNIFSRLPKHPLPVVRGVCGHGAADWCPHGCFGDRGKEIKEEENKMLSEFLEKLTAFNDRKTDLCIQCGNQVKDLEKIGRCVYARPCGCRLWQGTIPPAWKK